MEKILRMTMEIICLLTGQEDLLVKKFGEHIIIEPPPQSPKRGDKEKILELTKQIIELLTGEKFVDRAKDVCKDVLQNDRLAVCSSPDEPDVTSRFPTSSSGHPGDKPVGLGSWDIEDFEDMDITTEHTIGRVKREPDVKTEDDLSHTYDMEECSVLNIKKESLSGDEGDFTEASVSTPEDNSHYTTIIKKEEPYFSEETEYTANHIKEEPASGGEGILRDVDMLNIKKESSSGDEGDFTEASVSTPEDNSHYTTIIKKEELYFSEETEYTANNIKKEPASGGEGILRDVDSCSSMTYIKVKPPSCKQEHLRDRDINSHSLSTPMYKPGSKVNPSQIAKPNTNQPTNPCSINPQKVHGVKAILCSHCGRNFSCSSALNQCGAAHTEDKPFTCSECGKCVPPKPGAIVHQVKKAFACSDCGQQFFSRSHLDRHQMKHTGKKPFSCGECGKSYISNSALMSHQRSHRGNALYVCPVCGESFVQKSGLQQHVDIHTGEKPYACSECKKCFLQKSKLQKHSRVHLPKNKETFSCSECGKCYKRRADFRWHMLIHLGEK